MGVSQDGAGTEAEGAGAPELDEELRYHLAAAGARETCAALLAAGRAAAEEGDLEEAAACCRQALALRPSDRAALELLAEVRIAQEAPRAEVAGLFQAAARREPTLAWDLMAGLADLWERHGEAAEAESALRWACGIVPHDPLVHVGLASYLASAGRLEEAQETLGAVLSTVGWQPELAAHLAQVLVARGWYGQAARMAAEFAARGGPLPPELPGVLAVLEVHTECLQRLGDLLFGRPVRAEVAEHAAECSLCSALLERRRRLVAAALGQVLLAARTEAGLGFAEGGPVLGGTTTEEGQPVFLELSVEARGELLEVRFQPQEAPVPPATGRWAVEVSMATAHGPYPLGLALLDDGAVLLPAAIAGRPVEPAELLWRAVPEDELGAGLVADDASATWDDEE